MATFCIENGVNLTIVGPEDPLTKGVVDVFKKRGLDIFGPSAAAARLEGSKAYMKGFLERNNIKTARFLSSSNLDEISKFIDGIDGKIVVKADGLCAGKGVVIASNKDEAKSLACDMLSGESFGDAGKCVVVEEFLDGFELSFFAICDGKNFVSLPIAQDHKKLNDNDEGPNTGGMGAYAPSPLADEKLIRRVENEIIAPTLCGMKREGAPFCGVLFVGLMIVKGEPYVLEYNVRFGDPECEVLMPLIDGDYPYKSSPKAQIYVDKIPQNTHICYAGVSSENGEIFASGGRALVCVGVGDTILQARNLAYELSKNVKFSGAHFRKDIAYQALK